MGNIGANQKAAIILPATDNDDSAPREDAPEPTQQNKTPAEQEQVNS